MDKTHLEKSEATDQKISSSTTGNSKRIVKKANERPEWLPDGWSVDFRTRKSGANMGTGYKCYIDPLNGYKFYSKPEVLRYLDTIKGNSSSSKKEKGCTVIHSPSNVAVEKSTVDDLPAGSTKEVKIGKNSNSIKKDPVAIEKSTVDNLPPGWTKGVKIRKNRNGIRKDPYYTDPVNGYVFRSKKDALRYIESGDISKCLFKRRKRQIQDEDNSTPSSTAKRQKLKQPATKRQLFVGKEKYEKSSIELSDTNSSEKGHNVKVSAGETVVKMHSLEDAAANPPEMNKKSDPADVQEKNYVLNAKKNADEKNHSSPSISKNKKGLNVPHRFSRRLAGVEPDQVADPDNRINEQAQVPKRSLRKSRTILDVGLANVPSQPLNVVPKIDQVHKIPGESPNKSSNLSEGQGDFRDQPHRYSPSHDYSSPSLKGATKTTGDLPVLNNPHIGHGLAAEASLLKENKLNAGDIGKIGAQENKSGNKKDNHISRRASKRLAGFEPEITNTMDCQRPPEYEVKKSKVEVNAESRQSEDMPAKELADHASTYINAPRNGESSKRSKKSPKVPPRADEQLEKLGDDQLDDEKSEPQLSFAFHYSWSDPSVEFAIKTLTGALTVEDSVDKRPALVPETDVVQKNNLSKSVTEGSNDKNPQVTSKKSKNKKESSLPRRLSKRLAGHEPEVVPSERALEYATKKSCKDEPSAAATLGNGVSKHLDVVEETELALQTPNCSKRVHGESSNESGKSYEAQIVPNEQLQKVEAEKVIEKSEPELSLPFGDSWSDPCLEFAFKTLTGALPVDATSEILPVMTPDLNGPPNTGLLESVLEKCINEEAHDNSSQPQNSEDIDKVCQPSKQPLGQPELMISSTSCENAPKFATKESCDDANITRNSDEGESLHIEAIEMVCQPSKQLLGQPELRTSSTSCENTSKFIAGESHGDEANVTKSLDEGESLNIEAGNECQLARQSRNIDTLILEEPSNNIGKVLEEESAPAEQPQLEIQTKNQEKFELQFSAPLMDSWSDPCLEFAFKTLTGAIPVGENLSIQECFQEPANNFRSQRDGSSMLPDFGSPSFSQGEISFHYNVEKSMPGQQSSMSSSILPPENVGPHCFAGFDSQKHYSKCSKNSQGR